MFVITNNNEKIEIPFESPVCNSLTSNFPSTVIVEVKELKDEKVLSELTIDFIYSLKLDYLLYNFKVRYETDNPYLNEIKLIKQVIIPELHLHRLLKRFRGYEKYLVINFCDQININFVVKLGFVNILDFLTERNWNISFLVDEACRCGHLDVVIWFYHNTIFDYTELAIDDASKNGFLEIIEWFWKLKKDRGYKFKYKNAIELAEKNGYDNIVEWFKSREQFMT